MNNKSLKPKNSQRITLLNTPEMRSDIMNEILDKCRNIAPTRKPVLIIGEYGTGKGWIARLIHEQSDRKDQSFSKINCYSIQAEEVERKLFGYLSCTDRSVQINRGLFEKSNGGTLFVEGFEELPVRLQHQIIESVQDQAINHLGSSLRLKTDVRLITSVYGQTSKYNGNTFPADNTIYEINPTIIFQPPLRNRREDIEPLIHCFLEYYQREGSYDHVRTISPQALYLCIHYHWPGNIRQLKNAVKLATLLSDGKTLQPQHLPESIRSSQPEGDALLNIHQSKSFQAAEKYLIEELIQKMESFEKIALTLGLEFNELEEKIRNYQLRLQS
jgi:two-component system, NtrC family, response regulator AtoC